MAYRRGQAAGATSEVRKRRSRMKEKRELQAQLDAIEWAKQAEAREREKSNWIGAGIGFVLAAALTGGAAPIAALAAASAGGKTVGDIAYRHGAFNMQRNEIEEALDELDAMHFTSLEMDEAAEQAIRAGEVASAEITGKDASYDFDDFTGDLVSFGGDYLQHYMALASLSKLGGKGGELLGEDSYLDDLLSYGSKS